MSLGKWLTMVVILAPLAHAQPPAAEPNKDDDFWFSNPRRKAATAVQLIAAQDPLTLAVLRRKTLSEMTWGEFEVIAERVPPLDPEVLDLVPDHRPMPNFVGKEAKEIRRADRAIYDAYNQALINAFRYPAEAFKKAAKDHEHLKFAHLWNEPQVHRGKIVTVKGRLYRVRKYEAPMPAQEAGVKDLYEGWLFGETKGSHPFCIIFPVLPGTVPIAEQMDRRVTFHGYFLMRYKYRSQKGDLETPLLIGPTVTPDTTSRAADDSMPFPVFALTLVVVVLTGIVASMFVIAWWFRRGDTKIQTQLADLQHRRVRDMMESSPEWDENKTAG
jgi:hypothetical protein